MCTVQAPVVVPRQPIRADVFRSLLYKPAPLNVMNVCLKLKGQAHSRRLAAGRFDRLKLLSDISHRAELFSDFILSEASDAAGDCWEMLMLFCILRKANPPDVIWSASDSVLVLTPARHAPRSTPQQYRISMQRARGDQRTKPCRVSVAGLIRRAARLSATGRGRLSASV